MDLTLIWKALLIGVVEGLTEFLPVSSTGHIILAEELLDFQGPPGKVFEIVIQLGAILAVCLLYRAKIWTTAMGVLEREKRATRFALAILVAFLPAVIIGVARHGTNHQGIALAANARQLGNAVQINDLLRVGQAQAHGRQQTLSTGQQLAALGNELRGSGGGSRRFKGECVHGRISLCLGLLNRFPHAVGRCGHVEVFHAQRTKRIQHRIDHRRW